MKDDSLSVEEVGIMFIIYFNCGAATLKELTKRGVNKDVLYNLCKKGYIGKILYGRFTNLKQLKEKGYDMSTLRQGDKFAETSKMQ